MPVLDREFSNGLENSDSGVIDKYVQSLEILAGKTEELRYARWVCYIGSDADRITSAA